MEVIVANEKNNIILIILIIAVIQALSETRED